MKIANFLLIATPLLVSGLQANENPNRRGQQKSKNHIRSLLFEEDDLARKTGKKAGGKDSSESEEDSVVFGTCVSAQLQELEPLGIQCGFVEAPLDYDNPKGDTIQLAVSRLAHRDTEDYRGIILVNPGGPGGAGLILSFLGLFINPIVAAKYDWIGWDPRGAGESIPSFSCGEENYYDGYNEPPSTPEYADEWLQRGQDFANACAKAHKDLLPHMSTVNNARDMDSIRQALGAEMLNFYGLSYGTAIGQVYATLYPEKVGKFVLDSVVKYNQGTYEKGLNQIYEGEKVAAMFFDWTAQLDSVYDLGSVGSEVREKFDAAEEELRGNPAGGLIGPAEFSNIFAEMVFTHAGWLEAAQLLSDWIHLKNETQLFEFYSLPPPNNNPVAGLYAVNCREEWPAWPEYSDVNTDITRAFEDGILSAYAVASNFFPCYSWSADPAPRFIVDRNYQHEILFINLEFDASTPFSKAVEVRDTFRNSVLVNVPGAVGHAESILSGQGCLEAVVAEYLDSGSLPPRKPARGVADYDCVGKPLPDPTVPTDGRRDMEESDEQLEELRKALLRTIHNAHLG